MYYRTNKEKELHGLPQKKTFGHFQSGPTLHDRLDHDKEDLKETIYKLQEEVSY